MLTNKSQHISQQFEQELENVRSRVLAMGGLVEQQMANSLDALMTGDIELAYQVIESENDVNTMELQIDEECIQIIAIRQPTASDLRLITVILKTINDLERISDESVSIAKMALNLVEKNQTKKSYRELQAMGTHVRGLLHASLDAFARFDAVKAFSLAREDRDIDSEYESVIRQLITYMMEDTRAITRMIDMMWSARSLERIGDHAHNICEYIVYLVEGKDIRHQDLEKVEKTLANK